MRPVPQDCLLCGAPLKNEICPSCGWNPTAPTPGKTEVEILEERRRADLRAILGQQDKSVAAPVSSVPTPVQQQQQSSTDPDADLRGYLLGIGYGVDAIPGILEKNGAAIRASYEKAMKQQRSAPVSAPAVPQVPAPPVGTGWNG